MALPRIKELVRRLRVFPANVAGTVEGPARCAGGFVRRAAWPLLGLTLIGAAGYALIKHPPVATIENGEAGIRINQLTGNMTELPRGVVVVIPGLQRVQRYSLRDQIYRDEQSATADGDAPFQSLEGLSLGVDLTIRYALDPCKVLQTARRLPVDIGGQIVEPQVQGVVYKTFTRYTVREIFSSKRAEIQQSIEQELRPRLAADGVILRSVMMGKVDLPADYRNGLDQLLAEELATEKMRYTLDLKEKQVKQTALEADADAVRREKAAEAAGNEQIIAAKAQEESMKHVLPFKEKQIQQRELEADADKVARIKSAEANAEARKIEVSAEAISRQKLAEADAYRVEVMGKASSAQMERDGVLITKHPLLIQKTMADKLSDKISVIIAPPPSNGDFIGAALLGGQKAAKAAAAEQGDDSADNAGAQ
jgi:regulator of protease activity HflC (stomatin/prohibitin superfamily)